MLRGLQRLIALSRRSLASGRPEAELLGEDSERLSRRDFLARSGAAAGAMLLGGGLLETAAAAAAASGDPVVILGAGVSGLTAAYRLQQAGVPWALYEASPRFGGRMMTKRGFNADGMFCELGGELVDSNHRDLMDLCAELGLPLQPLASTKAGVSRNIYFFNGRAHTDAQLLNAVRPLVEAIQASLDEIYAGASERRPITYRNPQRAARLDVLTLREYLDSLTHVDRWVRDAVEIAYVTEFGLDAERQSALNVILLISTKADAGDFELFGSSDEALRVVGGSGRLTDTLGDKLGLAGGETARYKPRHELVKISDSGSRLALTFASPGGIVELAASRAICTIPFSLLRGVEGVTALSLSPQKRSAIAQMAYGTNSKLMLGFKDRFWRAGVGKTPPSNGGLFTDLNSQSFWDTARLQKGERGIMTNYTGGATGLARAMSDVQPSLADLDVVFPGLKARFEGSTAFMNWGRYPHNLGSYICSQPGDYTRHFGSAGETECGGRLLFAGEHTSIENGGYMNGGVETGNIAARAIVAVVRPKASATR